MTKKMADLRRRTATLGMLLAALALPVLLAAGC
jgi:hypothetical protein